MKHKFSSMGRVAIALVLALSLSLVMAVPVSALTEPTVTVEPTTASETAQYTIVFTTTSDLTTASSDAISIEFPTGTTVPASYATGDITVNTVDVVTASGSNQVVTMTVPADVPIGVVTVVFTTAADIVNPSTAATDYTLDVSTSEEVAVTSGEYTITAIVDSTDPTVTLDAPNGGESLAAGSTQSIAWTAADNIDAALTIKLEYYNGSSWTEITTLADTLLAAYSWTVPSVDSTECKVRVTATDDADNSASDVSDAVFTIDSTLPTVVVTAPNGGEVWVALSHHDITWTCTDTDLDTTPIDIDYSSDGGTTWASVAENEDNDGDYDWTLPAVYSATCLVKVTATDAIGNSGSDESNAVFTIDDSADPTGVAVTAPDGGETWAVGSTQSITWGTVSDNVDTALTIKLEYSADAGSSWTEITTLANTSLNVYSWTVPSVDSTNCLVKITATDDADNSASDASDAVFTIAAATEVWVGPNGLDTYPGTEAMPFATIGAGITAAGVDGIVNVLPGTYILVANPPTIATDGVTVQSTGGPAVTIIDATGVTDVGVHDVIHCIEITADGVTVEGFTVKDAGGGSAITVHAASNATVKNNIITSPDSEWAFGIFITQVSTGATVSGNELDFYNPMIVGEGSSEYTISGNTFDAGLELQAINHSTTDLTITDNIIIGSGACGILFTYGGAFDNILIEGNTISGTLLWSGFPEGSISFSHSEPGPTITNVTITGNDITNSEGTGIAIASNTIWGSGNTINNNNISGNLVGGINNATSPQVIIDAESNWWGDDTGPSEGGSGTGDAVSTYVDYSPWLTAAYAAPVAAVTTVSLESDWNLISLPLIPEVPAIETMLDGVDVQKVAYYTGGPEGTWQLYSGAPSDLSTMNDGKGYWMDMNATGELVFEGWELVAETDPPSVPPSYDVVEGWNLIGFKSTTPMTPAVYLGTLVDSTLEAIYGYNASTSAYFIPDNLQPGYGYWLAVNADGTIYP